MMSDINGLELTKEIRKLEREESNALAHTREGRPPIPIIALTATENPVLLGECRRAGIDDMVIKSTSFDSLIASIEQQIDKSSEPEREN
jgi:CheY-like chemotaxis protein